ncbi:MAG TPA: AEC family transporter, partial [Limnochordia bacterium]
YNSGNYGLPLIELALASPLATAVQTVVLSTQNLINFTAGLLLVYAGASAGRRQDEGGARPGLARQLGKFPFVYALALALLCKSAGWRPWEPVWTALEQLSRALVPIALVTLGAQLGTVRWQGRSLEVALATGIRLIAGPLIGWAWVHALGVEGVMAQALVLSTAVPTAVNVVLMAIEFDNEPQFVSQTVLVTTLASAVTVSLAIKVLGAR